MIECIRLLTGLWDVCMKYVKLIVRELSRENLFTKLTWNSDTFELFHDETIIFVVSLTYSHTGEIFHPCSRILDILQVMFKWEGKHESMFTLREFTSEYIIPRVRLKQFGIFLGVMTNTCI